jgi:hypothetical protein
VWQVVYVAPDQAQGQRVKDLLNQQGFLVMVRAAGGRQSGQSGGSEPQGSQSGPATAYEVLVPAVEAEEAQETITRLLAARLGGRQG